MSGGARYFWYGVAAGRRGVRWVWARGRRLDIRKPVHAVTVGVLLAGIVAPVSAWLIMNERYRMDEPMRAVVERPSPQLKNKLRYDEGKRAHIFNAEGQAETWDNPQAQAKLRASVGAGGRKNTQLYTATLPDQPAAGITIHDNVNDVSVVFRPDVALMDGRRDDGRVVYPLKDQPGQMVFTPKANGLKEDIVLMAPPAGGRAEFRYTLDIPNTLEARLKPDGSLGIYSGNPELFGNITYGTDNDRELVEKARRAAQKNYLMFQIPAPVIVQSSPERGKPKARFELDGKTLKVIATGLAQASYPLSIDPTFLISSTSEFLLGSSDDNVDLSVAGQVGRAALTGGSLTAWTTNTNDLPANNFAFGITAYNGFLYIMGGGNAASTTVAYAPINLTNGTVGTWTNLTSFNTGRVGMQGFGYNGYLYVVGGENAAGTTQFTSTEYAKLTSTGTIATDSGCGSAWCSGTSMSTGRAFFASAIYKGVIYAFGGETAALNATLTNTVEYARIQGNGSLGSWASTTNLTSARDRFSAAAYNGYVYVTGGLTNTTTTTALVQYAPILSDGSLGSWVGTTSFPTARRDHGLGVERGHIYVYGGCVDGIACTTFLDDTEYAVINADGTVGNWQQTNNTATARTGTVMSATTVYNGFLYSAAGCTKEQAGSNDCHNAGRTDSLFFTAFDTPGRFDNGISTAASPPYSSASTVARQGGQAVALNGYLYYISGCSVSNCNTATSYNPIVEKATINADGSLGSFSTTSSIITTDTTNNNAGRVGHSVVAYNNKLYVLGGVEKLKTNADNYRSDVISATQNSDGTLGTWAAETNALPAVRAFGRAVVWHDRIYYLGGRNSTTVFTTIWTAQFASNAPGTWASAKQTDGTTDQVLNNARWGHSVGLWGNWIYVVGGQSNTTGTYITAANGTEQLVLNNNGTIASVTTRNITGAPLTRLMGGMVHNGYLYTFGGYTNGSTSAVVTMNWSRLDPTTGIPATWSNTNIGNFTTPFGLATARGATTAVAVDGYMYILGGCTSTLATTSFTACSSFVSTTNTTELYLPNNGGTGQTGSWSTSGNTALTNAKADAATVAYNGYIYTIGGCTAYSGGACTTYSTEVRYAAIGTTGTIGSWSAAANALGTATALLQAAAYNGYLYVLGGQTASTAAVTTVQYAAIGSTGNIGTWTSTTVMGTARRNFGAAISQGVLYAAGGENASGTRLATVEYASLASDGSVGSWSTTTSFATARSGLSVVSYNGVLYVIGGYDGSNTLLDVQFGDINTDGTISSWGYTTDVPRGMRSRSAVAANGYMYFMGNDGSDTQVSYANINANGTLGQLSDQASALAGNHAHGGAVFYNGFLYALGGCTLSSGACSTVLSATENAGQKAVSRQAHYSKLFDTQVDTSPTQLVLSGALSGPGSAVAVQFQTASTLDPVLGVAQLINPAIFGTFYNVQALNSSGSNVGVAFNYFIFLTMDDSQAGTFPDVNQVAQTSVADITLYYHANPGRRLRHGVSFTDTECNSVASQGCILDTAP